MMIKQLAVPGVSNSHLFMVALYLIVAMVSWV